MDTEKLLIEAVEALDAYLNAGTKEERRKASEKAKIVYEKFHGRKYLNIRDRND